MFDTSNLSEIELALFTDIVGKLEVSLVDKKLTKRSHLIPGLPKSGLHPYKLREVLHCKTCNSVTIQDFDMIINFDKTGLTSSTAKDNKEPDVTNHRKISICLSCRSFLMEKSKEELVSMCLTALMKGGV